MSFVLIVEPEEVNAERIRAILESVDEDFEYQLVDSAEMALDVIGEVHTDVFIADMQMPVMSGSELFSMIEMISPDTIRIVMTDAGRISETVHFMNECRTFKIIIKPCRVADDLLGPIVAALTYKQQLEHAARLEKEAEDSRMTTQREYSERKHTWVERVSDSKRTEDVLAGLLKANVSYSDIDPEMIERVERWYQWMASEYINNVLNGPGDYETIARALISTCHNPSHQCIYEMRKANGVEISQQRMNEVAYILTLLTGICKDLLRNYQIRVLLESVEKAHILRIRFQINDLSFRIRNVSLRGNLSQATKIGLDALGYKIVRLDKEDAIILNIAIPK